jgi:hypothetical protein
MSVQITILVPACSSVRTWRQRGRRRRDGPSARVGVNLVATMLLSGSRPDPACANGTQRLAAATDMAGAAPRRTPPKDEPSQVIMAATRPDLRRKWS